MQVAQTELLLRKVQLPHSFRRTTEEMRLGGICRAKQQSLRSLSSVTCRQFRCEGRGPSLRHQSYTSRRSSKTRARLRHSTCQDYQSMLCCSPIPVPDDQITTVVTVRSLCLRTEAACGSLVGTIRQLPWPYNGLTNTFCATATAVDLMIDQTLAHLHF